MAETPIILLADDPLLSNDFAIELERQMRALDTYGVRDKQGIAQLLDPFILSKERKREIPLVGDPDDKTLDRIKTFYNAIAARIEKHSGRMAGPLIHLSHEGFGRGLITVGKLVVMDRSLRDAHRFGFSSLSKMIEEADKIVSAAVDLITRHGDVADL
ncbi:MAG: hypothetical protein A2516_03980 [Alphaproteobacteria bacterium RIFOXYD12_FULL_60_8]|nr:MAG: hypothetical protein A2516_03980 [Alphaproteobacteria bacterium RIFOXYD12_FULL_60_8]